MRAPLRPPRRRAPPQISLRIPHHHLVERHAHLVGGVPAEMLIGQEEDRARRAPTPSVSVAAAFDDVQTTPPCSPQKALMRGRRIDVRDRDDRAARRGAIASSRRAHLLEVGPAHLELIGIGHVGHRASGGEVRQDHLLMRRAQHVGALGHEVHAAEDDELGVGMLADLLRELVRVAGVVGELDHLVALVVMAEDDEPAAERRLRGARCARPSPRRTDRCTARAAAGARRGAPSRRPSGRATA